MYIEPSIVFTLLGRPAVYLAAGDSEGVACRAMPQGGGVKTMAGPIELTTERQVFHVLRSEVGTPADGTLTVDGTIYSIKAGEPVEGDARGLFWAAHASWGTLVKWLFVTGSGSDQNPPQLGGSLVAWGTAGASTIDLTVEPFAFAVGRLVTGDVLTVDGVDYTVTDDVSATSNEFVDVPITPALANTYSGFIAEPTWSAEEQVRAAPADYQASEILGGVQAGDRRLVIRIGDIGQDPAPDQRVEVDGETFRVVRAAKVYGPDGQAAAWDCQIRS